MGMEAAGMYLRTLREARHMSRAAVAAQIGTHESQLVRIEAGDQDTRGSLLLAFVNAVQGRADDIQRLMLDKSATAADGRQAANTILTQKERDWLTALANTDERRATLLRRVWELTNDAELRARIQGYLDALEERQHP
jgi:transcriptional regulator with XRE-family HTH domain